MPDQDVATLNLQEKTQAGSNLVRCLDVRDSRILRNDFVCQPLYGAAVGGGPFWYPTWAIH